LIHKEIPSCCNCAQELGGEILADAERQGYEGECLFSVRLCLEEALINAIRHGNKFDESKPVKVDYDIDAERIEIRVTDVGEGFDCETVPDPTADENLEKPSGRGVMLIRTFMDKVEYSEGGRCVRMVKFRELPDSCG
jgi:serine/threonine-protein kinase RsbW